jgi:hypothetical protein
VLAILSGLLSSADLVFAERLQDVLDALRLENIWEYIFRMTYIFIGAYLIAGGLLYAFWHSATEKVSAPGKPWPAPFLGWIEASTVLGSVNLLFGFFVVIQVQYLFGGNANINLEGFTYSEYARRGFSELVVVAALSLVLLLSLGTITRRQERLARPIFSGLGILLVVLVGVILVSAFQRLALYEQVYGFTRLRTYTFVFMGWLALLLVITVLLELRSQLHYFALAALITALGFVLSLGLLNVDAFIARQNIARAAQGLTQVEGDDGRADFDWAYLNDLSDDAVPTMINSLDSQGLPSEVNSQITAALVCRQAQRARQPQSWVSWHASRWQAERLLAARAAILAGITAWREDGYWYVRLKGEPVRCR